jgi:hypothetical protein
VTLEHLLAAGGAPGVGAEVEAQVDRAHDRGRVAAFRLAPRGQHVALVLPVLGPDVGGVPAIGVLRGGPQGALLPAAADPDRDARLERLRVVRRVGHREVLALKVRAALLGIEQHAHDLRILFQHVLARADRRERIAERLRFDTVPAGAQPAVHAAAGEVVDRGERLREQAGVPVHDAVHPAAEADVLRVHRRRGERGDRLVAVHVAAARGRLLEVVGHREPVEAFRVGELPQLAHLVERPAHVPDVDPEFHLMLTPASMTSVCPVTQRLSSLAR